MPTGQWERCGAKGGTNSSGFTFTCTKKAGHKDKEHADTKTVPVPRWRD